MKGPRAALDRNGGDRRRCEWCGGLATSCFVMGAGATVVVPELWLCEAHAAEVRAYLEHGQFAGEAQA